MGREIESRQGIVFSNKAKKYSNRVIIGNKKLADSLSFSCFCEKVLTGGVHSGHRASRAEHPGFGSRRGVKFFAL
jgi:hypothetical protein